MNCEQILKLSEALFSADDQEFIETALKDVGVGYTAAILRLSLRNKLHVGLLDEARVRAVCTEASLDPKDVAKIFDLQSIS